ncbi:MAG: FAD-dependent oxidoreductase, partial [Oscillospiraceae bacterium]|nr:FAD-dependent oxidoreductase [Oscillospiraceae bacterium]
MNNIKLTIDKIEVTGCENQTILDIAKQNGIEIPTLCHDEKVEAFGACGLCVVEIEGSFRLFRSCSTLAQNGMVVFTDTERIQKNRQTTLELLMGDHVGDCLPPCTLACPANTACQGYAKLIACGEYAKAVALIKEKVPFPASLGRICPRPCEAACRRELVEEPIAICALKQFAGDWNIHQNAEPVAPVAPTGKSVAVIGGGPGGLSAAYFLRQKGHAVSVYEAMPKMGGMLQYGVPEYRLPKEILQKEISEIEKTGVKFFNNIKIGKDMALSKLQKTSDAVLVASGAWKNARLGCPGEDLGGVLGAIDFLKDPSDHNFSDCTVAVVGGGDIAMDACRTAVRLGAA